ncbi:hypothetical protein PHYBLDRAFT_141824 [Phycomyces blakesleeanus NRRL 1555(-)]|uniref:Uncharacterized protein n=1 Tax=Phycomyces blakesleeanus (strain ATCC 8743b / DSM 1359 / FGSC 10004 / NBRC 33097 / NRRL 1555) TaxID=763407 RepID=A0A167PI06_PHYB8|nr:hypothetical protein PHYBLDRAFT_141824 [Phycomyces blakesleeanus NRRL 1555(-)]OAD77964.1 hypothetical protein PHYBLDRAFT_141824 [Phycomyces blakesleeanus NRRL 1555(-)]|eukprot:XP_018296004.1 hypothetical protein PHYBLDRAFT_141824 [Phycomyces blakesleeanus NRRL 1555(-)]
MNAINGFHTASHTATTSSSGHLCRKLPVKYDNNDQRVVWKAEARSSSATRQHTPFQANGCFQNNIFRTTLRIITTNSSGHLRRKLPVRYDNKDRKTQYKRSFVRSLFIRLGHKNFRRAYVSLFWTYKRERTNDLLYCVLRSLLSYLTGSFLRKCPDELVVIMRNVRCLTSPLLSIPLFLRKRAANSFFPFAVKSGLRPEGDGSTLFSAQVSRRAGCGSVRCGVETVDLENICWLGMVHADVQRCLTPPLFFTPLFLRKRAANSFFPLRCQIRSSS